MISILALFALLPLALHAEWEIASNMPNPRHGLAAVELNGKIYLIGGQEAPHHGGGMRATDLVTVYDPATNSWATEIASLNYARSYGYATTHNGYIYVAGGRDNVLPVSQVERYNPETNRWSVVTDLPFPREGLSGAVWGDSLFVIGGINPDSVRGMSRVDIFRFSDSTWTTGPRLHHARAAGLTLRIRDRLYVLGGLQTSPLASMEILENNSWMTGPDLPESVANFGGAAVGDSIIIAGGTAQHGTSRNCYIFEDGNWVEGPQLNYPRAGLAMVNVGEKVYIFGGRHHQSAISQVEVLDLRPVGIGPETGSVPQEFTLGNYPNPFNPSTTIRASLPEIQTVSGVKLFVYNLLGQLIYSDTKPYQGAGVYTWRFSVQNLHEQLAGGVYMYKVAAGNQQRRGKMVYLP